MADKETKTTKPAQPAQPTPPDQPVVTEQEERPGAGEQFGETPGPIPATNSPAKAVATAGEFTALPRTDAKIVQPTPPPGTRIEPPVVEQPQNEEAALTAPADRIVTVGAGQTLTQIARFAYGDEDRAVEIFEANRDVLISPDALTAGQTLRIPS